MPSLLRANCSTNGTWRRGSSTRPPSVPRVHDTIDDECHEVPVSCCHQDWTSRQPAIRDRSSLSEIQPFWPAASIRCRQPSTSSLAQADKTGIRPVPPSSASRATPTSRAPSHKATPSSITVYTGRHRRGHRHRQPVARLDRAPAGIAYDKADASGHGGSRVLPVVNNQCLLLSIPHGTYQMRSLE